MGEDIPGTGRAQRTATVLEVLPAHAMFPDIGWAHWQVGRRGGRWQAAERALPTSAPPGGMVAVRRSPAPDTSLPHRSC
ncbi:hypothetical protein AB0D97_28260 [Streptomyces roseus]|uniref:hypothetical protein n=1 Tax=Streptomyces roseus TaxID=66430 RepID=UPI0033E49845